MNTGSVSRLAVLVMTLIATLLLAQGVAMAVSTGGILTFVDLTDTITLSDTTGRAHGFSCTGESCSVTLDGPAGAAAPFLSPREGAFFTEPGTNVISDELLFPLPASSNAPVQPDFSIGVTITFISDTEPGSLGMCPLATCLAETGLVQTAATIEWFNGAGGFLGEDTIKFQSDVSDVPEPPSALLLLAGVSVVAIAYRRARG